MRKTTIGIMALSAFLLGGCSSEPEWEDIYEQCKETVTAKSEELKANNAQNQDEQTRAMADSMSSMVIGMAMSACENIRTTCEKDEDGPACQAYIDQAKQNQ